VPTDFAAELKALNGRTGNCGRPNQILRKASAYFPQAKFDRRLKP
jgi:hypothetical protein